MTSISSSIYKIINMKVFFKSIALKLYVISRFYVILPERSGPQIFSEHYFRGSWINLLLAMKISFDAKHFLPIHFQKRSAFQNESWQNNFCKIHSNTNLRQEMRYHRALTFHIYFSLFLSIRTIEGVPINFLT